jgi:hypothetical protein
MGWGHESVADTIDHEQRAFGELRDDAPTLFTARAPKTPDPEVMRVVRAAMQRDGFSEKSLSLRYFCHPAFGEVLKWPAQLIGSCVASGSMRAVAYRALVEVLAFGQAEKLLGSTRLGVRSIAPFAPYHYGAGRRRGNLRGGDGSFCSAQIEAFQKDGILMCSHPQLDDIVGTRETDYPEPQNERLYRQWGDWKYLDDFIGDARKIKLVESEPIRDVGRLIDAIAIELKPAMICSNWGFEAAGKADNFAIYSRRGQWAHNMTLSGVRYDSRDRAYIEVTNSWGPSAHKDGECFYVAAEEVDRWLRDRGTECQTIGELDLPDQSVPVVW